MIVCRWKLKQHDRVWVEAKGLCKKTNDKTKTKEKHHYHRHQRQQLITTTTTNSENYRETVSDYKNDLCFRRMSYFRAASVIFVPTGSPSRGGDVAAYVFNISQPSLSTPFYYVLVSVSVFMALSTVFHSTNSPDNSPLSHSVLPVSFLPYWSFQLYISL